MTPSPSVLGRLTTEAVNPASARIDELDAAAIVAVMNAEDALVAAAVARESAAIARAIDVIADRFRRGGRLVYIGAGTSGRLGVLDASECPPTFGTPPEMVVGLIAGGPQALTRAVEGAEDSRELAAADLAAIGLSAADVLVGIATSGRTPYVLGGLAHARAVNAFAIGFACNDNSELEPLTDLMIVPRVGPEIVTGSTRLKAGTATKMVLNMLTTGAMIRIGTTYGNLMVDLRATNTKLVARTRRIVTLLTGASEEEAERLVAAADGELKTAVVSQARGVSPADARRLLAEAGYPQGIKIPLICSNRPAIRSQVGVAVKQMAAPAGFDIDVQTIPHDTYLANFWRKGNFYIGFWGMQPTEDAAFTLLFTTDAAFADTAWNNKEFDELVARGRSSVDEAERRSIYAQAQALMIRDRPSIIPFFQDVLTASRNVVKGWTAHPLSRTFYVENVWVDRA